MATFDSDTEEYIHDDDRMRSFIDVVQTTAEEYEEITDLLAALEAPFEELLADDDWLDEKYQQLSTDEDDDMETWATTLPSGCYTVTETSSHCSRGRVQISWFHANANDLSH